MNLKQTEYQSAYTAWDTATTKYLNAMRSISNGQMLENFSIDVLLQDMAKCKSRLDAVIKAYTFGV